MSIIDYFIIIVYLAVVVYIGYRTGKKETTLHDFFLGGRNMSWRMVMISIYATSTSALTFIGVPGAAYGGDFHYLSLVFGSITGRILIAILLITPYYQHSVLTVYQLLHQKFGNYSRKTGAGIFIVTRILASGVRLAGSAIALAVIFEIPLSVAILVISVFAAVYTMMGGIKAVMYTDMIQFFILLLGAIVALIMVLIDLPGGFHQFYSTASAFGKFEVFNWDFSLNNPEAFFAGTIFGLFVTFAALGTDQDLVQRMLTCKKDKDAKLALILTGFMDIPIVLLFLSIGAGLFVYYQVFPDVAVNTMKPDHIFPYFIKMVLPVGIKGLVLAGLLATSMSSLDSALNALAQTVYVDFYSGHESVKTEKRKIDDNRYLVVVFTILLASVAWLFTQADSVLWIGFKSVGYTYGSLSGVFLAGIALKNYKTDIFNAVIMILSIGIVLLSTSIHLDQTDTVFIFPWDTSSTLKPTLAWPWGIIIGTCFTFVCIYFTNKLGEKKYEPRA